MIVLLKTFFLFILLQQLAKIASLRGFSINWKWVQKPWMLILCLAIFFILYPRVDFAIHWITLMFPVLLVTLLLASLFPTQGYKSKPIKLATSNLIDYYLFTPKIKSVKVIKVFFHGSGNDSLFDNFELFNQWYDKGFLVVAINLPGHGLTGKSILNPKTASNEMEQAWEEIYRRYEWKVPIHMVGESLGAKFALWNGLKYKEITESHLLCHPKLVQIKPLGMIWEIFHFFFYQLWWRLKSNTFWDAIPSFSSFKRKLYPIRHTLGPEEKSINVYKETIRYMEKEMLVGIKNKNLRVLILHGLLDGIIPYEQATETFNELKEKKINATLQPTRAAHLSIKKWYIPFSGST